MNESTDAPLTELQKDQELADVPLVLLNEKFVGSDLPIDFGNHRYEVKFRLLPNWYYIITVLFLAPIFMFLTALPLLCARSVENLLVSVFIFLLLGWYCKLVVRNMNLSFVLSKRGIMLPKQYAVNLLNRCHRTWDDLHSIKLEENLYSNRLMWLPLIQPSVDRFKWTKSGKADSEFSLQLDFSSGGNASIPLDKLTRLQCRCLFLAIENWVAQSKLDKDVIKLKHAMISDSSTASYTDIWMQDLEQRYAITNFTPLVVGQRLLAGNYTVISVLSTRGQTAVYLTQDKSGRQLVLKEIVSVGPDSDKAKEKAREMFQRQSEILMKLHHPQIARVVDCFVENGRDYLALEYIPGKTLRQLVKVSGPRQSVEVVQWLDELLDILAYLHECAPPIVHRDLTPDNIVLKTDGTIAVIDFGAANEFLGTATGTLVGKQSYVAPEQFRGRAQPASDIYSLGATAYFLITGKDPIPLSESKISISDVPEHLDYFILRCTQLELADRFASAIEAKEFLSSKKLTSK